MLEDYLASDPTGSTDSAPQKRTVLLTFSFLNYRVDQIDPSVFSETKYLFFDGPNEIVPTAGYKDFTIYKNF
jgi:hypothetical protein